MTKLILVSLLVSGLGAGLALLVVSAYSPAPEQGESKSVLLQVTGMTCSGCEAAVKMAVRQLDGIRDVTVSYQDGTAVVMHDPSIIEVEEIKAAIEKLGYTVKVQDPEEEGDSK